MFKDDSITTMNKKHFGAGSVVYGGAHGSLSETFLVVRFSDNQVGLISNDEFKLIGKLVTVRDPNYLTSKEARELVDNVGNVLNWTFSDFELSSAGQKEIRFNVK